MTEAPTQSDAVRFGRFELLLRSRALLRDGVTVKLGARAFDLLALLVAERHRVVTTEELLREVWPGVVVAENNLQVQVSALRRLLGGEALSTVARRGYRFTARVYGDEAPQPADAAPPLGDAVVQPDATRDSAAVLRFQGLEIRPADGVVLVGGQAWTLRPQAMTVLLALARRAGQAVDKHLLMDLAWPGLAVSENHLAGHIASLRKVLGPAAIATIPGQGYLFNVPGQAVGAAMDNGDAAAVARRPAGRGNLPQRQLALLGRQSALAHAVDAVRSNVLVTLCGAGGIGKTQLALAAGMAHRDNWRDGVWWVALAGIAEAGAAPAAIAQCLGLSLPGRAPVLHELLAALRPLHLLLVLDNCEHLGDGLSALVRRLVEDLPEAHVLATSRVPLRVPGEVVQRIEPLAVPQPSASGPADLDLAVQAGAVQLFVERARASSGRFELDHRNVSAVVEICMRLDGLPLAIELAAARVPLLGVDGVLDRLDRRFQLLRASHPSGTSHHRTLLAAFDWSHDQLTPEEQVVYRRLGVFSGGFTPSLAQQVVADDTMDGWAVLDHLGSLVEKSLVVADGAQSPRCHLLETTREHALAHLARAGESDTLARRHAAALCKVFDEALAGRDSGALSEYRFSDLLKPELGNARVAFESALRLGEHELVATLADASGALLFMLGRAIEALGRLQLAAPSAATIADRHPVLAARVWRRHGRCGVNGRLPDDLAIELLGRAVEVFARQGEARLLHESLWMQAEALLDIGETSISVAALARAAELEQPDWHPIYRLRRQRVDAMVHIARGDLDRALDVLAVALNDAERHGVERQALTLRTDRAKLQLTVGRIADATEGYRIVVERTAGRDGDVINHADALVGASACALAAGQRGQCIDALQRATAFWRRSGLLLPRGASIAWLLEQLGEDRAAAHWLGAVDRYLQGQGSALREQRFHLALDALQAKVPTRQVSRWMAEGAMADLESLASSVDACRADTATNEPDGG